MVDTSVDCGVLVPRNMLANVAKLAESLLQGPALKTWKPENPKTVRQGR